MTRTPAKRKKNRAMPAEKDVTNARLKALRDKTGLTQAEFGKDYFRVSLQTYFRYESTKNHSDLPGPVQLLIELYENDKRFK